MRDERKTRGQFVEELVQAVRGGGYCALLGSPGSGKTSLLALVHDHLANEDGPAHGDGPLSVWIDLAEQSEEASWSLPQLIRRVYSAIGLQEPFTEVDACVTKAEVTKALKKIVSRQPQRLIML